MGKLLPNGMIGSSTEAIGRIVMTTLGSMEVATGATAHSLLAPGHKNAPRLMDFFADSCIAMLMSIT